MTQEEKVRAYDKALSVALETYKTQPMYKDWLEKMFPELKESEEERVRKALTNGFIKLDKSAVWYNGITNGQILDWLEKQVQKPTGWSEEDETNLEKTIWYIEKGGKLIFAKTDELVSWLKSLRPQWKPSDEQMKALNYVVNLMASSESPRENDYYYNVFKDLRKQLKKLREDRK